MSKPKGGKKDFGDKKPFARTDDGDRPYKAKPKPHADRASSPLDSGDVPLKRKPRKPKPDGKTIGKFSGKPPRKAKPPKP